MHSIDSERRTYSVRLQDGTIEHNVPFRSVVFPTAPPVIPFQSSAALPKYFENDFSGEPKRGLHATKAGSMLVQSKDAVLQTTTSHLLRMLHFAQSWDIACSASDDQSVSLVTSPPDVDMLCGQIVWLIVSGIAQHSTTNVDINAIEEQLLDVQDTIDRDPSREEDRHWINSAAWDKIRQWVDVMTSRILSPHKDNGQWKFDEPDMEECFEMASPTRARTK